MDGFLDEFVSNVLFLNNYPENRVGKPRLAFWCLNDWSLGWPSKNRRCSQRNSATDYFCHLNGIRFCLGTWTTVS